MGKNNARDDQTRGQTRKRANNNNVGQFDTHPQQKRTKKTGKKNTGIKRFNTTILKCSLRKTFNG